MSEKGIWLTKDFGEAQSSRRSYRSKTCRPRTYRTGQIGEAQWSLSLSKCRAVAESPGFFLVRDGRSAKLSGH